MIGYVILTGFALFMAALFAHMAWTGRIKSGTRIRLDRREAPLRFWVAWTIALGVTVFAYVHFVITVSSYPGGPLAR